MSTHEVATAMQRAQAVFRRRPAMALDDDSSAAARWESGLRIVSSHPNGTQIASDMPTEIGGTGDRITPGWMFRAGLAACSTTTIAMAAAAAGVELTMLEVHVGSRSDARGLLGMTDDSGQLVRSLPRDYQLKVRIAAHGVAPERLRAVVDDGLRRSPMANALQTAMPLSVRVDIDAAVSAA